MKKIGLLVATAAVVLGISASSASAVTSPQLQLAGALCSQQGGLFALHYNSGTSYTCTTPMSLFDLVKGKTACSVLFGGTFSTLPSIGPSIILFPNNGYECHIGKLI